MSKRPRQSNETDSEEAEKAEDEVVNLDRESKRRAELRMKIGSEDATSTMKREEGVRQHASAGSGGKRSIHCVVRNGSELADRWNSSRQDEQLSFW